MQASRVIVVIGHQGEALIRALEGRKVEFLGNDAPAEGMSGSLFAGLRKTTEGRPPDGVMTCLGDMPLIKPSHISGPIQRFSETPGSCVWRPVYKGTRGHPVIFSTGTFDGLSTIQGDTGAKNTTGFMPRRGPRCACPIVMFSPR
ncbi:NTP transferase domain-containing protein [Marinobacter sp. TBZ242]|uniref:NTP transferase domain-containing protein n=1 Tax=Marinobacter azerbaijanicus TaxID=3050455 RepID=A0ABT7IGJ3_9GAMM|nr:NTP transferase domain-containing protein [Marinobacter sp. TBZ242]MDL0433292.1 NTP transferase domain-containing protein [Marinobacter sp. TBZ242]